MTSIAYFAVIPVFVYLLIVLAVAVFFRKDDPSKLKKWFVIDSVQIILASLYVDFFSKAWIRDTFALHEGKPLIDGVLELCYIENTGAVFGLMAGQTVLFLVFTVIILIGCVVVYFRIPADRRYSWLIVCISLIVSGAVGNAIDRVWKQQVTDFIYVSLIDFPIFNFADICVVVGVFVLIFLALFVYKDKDFEFLNFKQKDIEEKNK
jgi:signal peptidase II